jgi:hypothetical protein
MMAPISCSVKSYRDKNHTGLDEKEDKAACIPNHWVKSTMGIDD